MHLTCPIFECTGAATIYIYIYIYHHKACVPLYRIIKIENYTIVFSTSTACCNSFTSVIP